MLEIVRAIRARVGNDFHLQMKISAVEHNNALAPFEPSGNTLEDSVQVCQWLEQAGVDAFHVSTGSSFPHPKNPPGDMPIGEFLRNYDSMISSGTHTLRNYLLFRDIITSQIFHARWISARGDRIEGVNLPDARAIKQAVGVPVICTGGFQNASAIRQAISEGSCDAVSMARALVANNDLVTQFANGVDQPPVPCPHCNKCLINAAKNPLGCYEEARFASPEAMVGQILPVFQAVPAIGGAS